MLERLGISPAVVWWVVIVSGSMFGLGVLAIPLLVTRIPVDYFAYEQRSGATYPRRHIWIRWIWLIAKNLLGLCFLVLGALMLVLPGQGLLTILIAAMLLDYPGKFRLQRWVVSRPGVLDSMNWVRAKACKPALRLDTSPPRSDSD